MRLISGLVITDIYLKITYSAGPDTEGEDISDAGHGDGHSCMLHRQSQPLRQGPLRDSGVLVEVVPAGHDDEHVIYPDPLSECERIISVWINQEILKAQYQILANVTYFTILS